jgi:hypothetical protein
MDTFIVNLENDLKVLFLKMYLFLRKVLISQFKICYEIT